MRPDRGAYQRSDLDRLGVSGGRPHAAWPLWARWNDELGQRYTLGVEEEVMLLDPTDWSLAQSSDRLLEQLSNELSARTFPETHAAVIELATDIHADVHGVVAELASLRNQLAHELGEMGLTVAAAGTHPLTIGVETEVSGAAHYRALGTSLRMLARREPTMALHVHVGVPARGRDPGAEWLAPPHPGCACAVGQFSVLAGTRQRVRVRPHIDLPGLPPRRPTAVLRRLRRLRQDDRPADRIRGDTRPKSPFGGTCDCNPPSGPSRYA